MKKTILAAMMFLLVIVPALSEETITVKGSDTMVILAQRWAEKYMQAHKDVVIQVTGGGSGTGISALINGTTDICNASRPMKPSERDKLKARYGSRGVEIKAAMDGLSVYVNESSPVTELSLQQLKGIYTGKITNWSEVGGPNARIILYGRENNSGTYVYFKDNVLEGEDYVSSMQSLPGTAAVVNAVARDKNGIGYGGAAYGKGIRELKMKKDAASPAYPPTLENIRSGDYPVSRFLYLYVRNRPTGTLKEYIDWVLGDDGQKVVTEVGYFPIR
ncbi:MAG: phosphate ABC transporter substrate-binding protein [Bacteroidetes bacterium]|nr:phosphate ABC transporter substrate-binding protein [Bacteroidota bacterium]